MKKSLIKTNYLIFTSIGILFVVSFFFSISKGSAATTFSIVWQLRLPRTLTALVCGGLLALSGSLMQLLLQNPLADPYVLGISSGAAFFSLLMIIGGFNEWGILSGAWLGSLITIMLVLALAKKHRFQPHTLLLTGVSIASAFSACISFLLLLSPANYLHNMLFWLTGDLNDATLPWSGIGTLFIGFMICLYLSPGLNLLLRGEKEAQMLGLSCLNYKMILYLLSSFFTAQVVTMGGCIGFIGLIIPHLSRILVGHNHRLMLPISVLLGASLLMSADTLARTLLSPEQLPVGIIITLIGVPIFIWLLQR